MSLNLAVNLSCHARAFFQDSGHGGLVERPQAFLVQQAANELAVLAEILVGVGHLRIELRLHLEDLAEILVVVIENLVGLRVTDQDHLDIDIDRLGFQRRNREEQRIEPLNRDLLVLERPLQGRPDRRLDNDVLEIPEASVKRKALF